MSCVTKSTKWFLLPLSRRRQRRRPQRNVRQQSDCFIGDNVASMTVCPLRILLALCPWPLPTRGMVGFLFMFTAPWVSGDCEFSRSFGGFETAKKKLPCCRVGWGVLLFCTEIFKNRHLLQGGPRLPVIFGYFWGYNMSYTPINGRKIP